MPELPFSQACENNKEPILSVLRQLFAQRRRVLEIASGTGQHACHFAAAMPWLQWQPTDIEQYLRNLAPRCRAYEGENLATELALDVTWDPWPVPVPHAIFTANSLHIMPFTAVQSLFAMLGREAPPDAVLAVYGPFNYGGRYTSDSNARFDEWLAQQTPYSAIRDFEAVDELALNAGFVLEQDNPMPANNRLLVWCRGSS